AEMTTDQDLPMDSQSATAMFAAKGLDVTPNKDQGVIKIVKCPGLGAEQPMIGDRVTVHYTGKLLTGKTFDCSRDRKEPFCFNVGRGQVLKAWDICVLSMQKGEACTLLCKPDYAYGPPGNPDKIPPNSSVIFEMELVNFEGELLTDDSGIMRRIKVKGDGYTNPNDGASVDVHLEGRCAGRLFDCRDVSFIVGEAEDRGIPLGVDRAMDKMQRGEHCAKESWEMDLKEKLEIFVGVKHKGNQYFKAGRYLQAVIQYQRIVSWFEMECGTGLEQQKKIQECLLTAHLNLALCFLRLKEFSQVVDNCNKVIECDESNEKALYRRGEARLLRNEFNLARADFQQVLLVNPSNRAARAQISICQTKIKEHHEQDKRTYANMFKKFAERDAKTRKSKRRWEESMRNGEVGIKRRRSSQECQS
uniref:peptidylprolyl isomerase n=1 Tax=Echeneis naucrates TaxID=173247 RepID=A0A665VHX0_ECHNA